jgi:O-antigen ligase
VFGPAYGSRIVELGPRQNAAVLDDQWLGFLLETGLVGVLALGWAVGRAVRRLGRIARSDPSSFGLLAGSLAASVMSFAVGIVTYDAFGFVQVTLLFFVVLALAGAVIAVADRDRASAHVRPPLRDAGAGR